MYIRKDMSGSAPLNFRVARAIREIQPPDKEDPQPSKNHSVGIILGCIFASCVVAGFLVIGYLRWRRLRKPQYALSGRDDNDHSATAIPAVTTQTTTVQTPAATVDRNTSVRSVMTLPPYRPKASDNEHVLGREGERGGIDVVLELPTAEEEESLREEEMDTLFQIRQARRRQAAEREERRRARQEARDRNDRAALQSIRQQTQLATTNNSSEIDTLRAELERSRDIRTRAVSKVNYADVGVARHDGTRIRANSSESERVGLLSDAASIGASNRSSGLQQSLPATQPHHRDHSASSVISLDTTHSDGVQSHGPPSARSRTSSIGQHTRAGSSPELIDAAEADMGDSYMPSHSPPGYDEVSLNDLTPAHSRSTSPYPEPPPDYTPSTISGQNPGTVAAESSGAAARTTEPESSGSISRSGSDRDSRSAAIARLPSLRLPELPQIVIEPSSAVTRDDSER